MVPASDKKKTYDTNAIIHPAIGTIMRRVTKTVGRPRIDAQILDLKTSWDVALLGPEFSSCENCVLCSTTAEEESHAVSMLTGL